MTASSIPSSMVCCLVHCGCCCSVSRTASHCVLVSYLKGWKLFGCPVNSGQLLAAGVVPSTARWLDLGSVDAGGMIAPGEIAPGAIPAGVRWLKLEREHQRTAHDIIAHCVDVEVVWYRDRGNEVLD